MVKARKENLAARRAALEILKRLDKGQRTLDQVLSGPDAPFPHDMARVDRNLANAIVYGVLRWRRRLDWVVQQHASRRLSDIDSGIRNILRLALFQILFLDRVPDFAAVDTAVELAKREGSVKTGRFVNAVLRSVLRSSAVEPLAYLSGKPTEALAVSESFPDWLIHRWVKRFGMEEATRLCKAVNRIPPLTIRANTLKTSREELERRLIPQVEDISPTPHAPHGLRLVRPKAAVDQLYGFREGWFQVQDEAAQLAGHLLCPQPGERVLDACAGMGGKTGHLAQLMENRGEIVAADKDAGKLEKLGLQMERLGVANVKTCRIDFDKPENREPIALFDRILLDAPCSGTGVIRRNPDIKWANEKGDLDRFAGRQLSYLSALAQRLSSGGVLVYAVCSMEPEETWDVIEKFLKNRPEFAMVTGVSEAGAVRMEDPLDPRGFFSALPHVHEMDGFFAVRLRRN
jgi:16S rRNA (cytosine967-C5)-methyltransferase